MGFERKKGFKDYFPGVWHEMEMFVEEALGKIRHEEFFLERLDLLKKCPLASGIMGLDFREEVGARGKSWE